MLWNIAYLFGFWGLFEGRGAGGPGGLHVALMDRAYKVITRSSLMTIFFFELKKNGTLNHSHLKLTTFSFN